MVSHNLHEPSKASKKKGHRLSSVVWWWTFTAVVNCSLRHASCQALDISVQRNESCLPGLLKVCPPFDGTNETSVRGRCTCRDPTMQQPEPEPLIEKHREHFARRLKGMGMRRLAQAPAAQELNFAALTTLCPGTNEVLVNGACAVTCNVASPQAVACQMPNSPLAGSVVSCYDTANMYMSGSSGATYVPCQVGGASCPPLYACHPAEGVCRMIPTRQNCMGG